MSLGNGSETEDYGDGLPDETTVCPDCGHESVSDTPLDDGSGRVQSDCDECEYTETFSPI
jgi:transcription elongation factor Elf1